MRAVAASSDAELSIDLAQLDGKLHAHLARTSAAQDPSDAVRALLEEHGRDRAPQPPVDEVRVASAGLLRLAELHGLSRFDCSLLLLAVAPHVDRRYARLYVQLDGDARPSIGFAFDVLAEPFALPRRDVLARVEATAPLVANGLLRVAGDGVFTTRRLEVPDLVWKRVVGAATEGMFPLAPRVDRAQLVTWGEMASELEGASAWLQRGHPVVVRGARGAGRQGFASAIAAQVDHRVMVVERDHGLPIEIARESAWYDAIPVVAARPDLDAICMRCSAVIVIAEPHEAVPTWVSSCAYHVAIDRPDSAARVELWRRQIGTRADVDLGRVVDQFRFGPGQIEAASTLTVLSAVAQGTPPTTRDALHAARQISRVHLDRLAERLPSELTLDDLVLAPKSRRELELAIAWGRQLPKLRSANTPHLRSLGGLACLFCGPSGTGKTTAAAAVGRALELPVYRVDLSQVVDKYIGETEKNLSRIFDEAEAGNVVLFFDEADALFTRRIEVKDAHDRFANLETGYLLQRLERHPGIAILATNLQGNIDDAFARRLQVIVEFGMPDTQERCELWRRMLPVTEARDLVDIDFLAARFPLSGGDIRNAVVASLVLADSNALAMEHVMVAVWRELQRSGRLTDGADFAQWQGQLTAWIAGRPRAGA